MPSRGEYCIRIEAYRVDANFHQKFSHLGIVRRRLSADTGVAAVTFCSLHRQANHLFHSRIAFIEIEGDDFRIAIHAERQLGQVIGADGESVEQFGEGVDQDDRCWESRT